MARPVGWILDPADRARLLGRCPPRYEETIAHHVTLWGHRNRASLPAAASFAVVGHADAGDGIEALVVTVDGEMERPDGNLFHCTWSLDRARGKAPKDSNTLIAEHGFASVEPIAFGASPGFVA